MTIIPLAKVTLLGLSADREHLLDGLQSLGCVHLIPLAEALEEVNFVASRPSEDARQALRYLMDVRHRRHQTRVDADFDFDRIVAEALANRQRKREAEDRVLTLRKRLEELKHWGNFELPDIETLAGFRLWFYRVPPPKAAAFRQALSGMNVPWQRLHESARNGYYALIAEQEPDPALLPVPRSHVGFLSHRDVSHQLDTARTDLEDVEAEHESLSRWIFLLSKHLSQAEDAQARQQASGMALDDSTLLQLQGWIPRPALPRLDAFTRQHGLAYLAEVPEPKDNPPTLLRNPSFLSGGQDLVTFYETPAYRDWDPSIMVFFSFAFFFAIIMADAGYALVLGLLVAVKWKAMGRSPSGRHFRILAVVGLLMSLVYGILIGCYFGIDPPPGSLLARFKLLNLYDFSAEIKLSVVVGCIHLLMANGIVALRARSLAKKAPPIGWMAVILGGVTLYLGGGVAPYFNPGIGLIAGGLLTVLLFSSEHPVKRPADLLLRLLEGLESLMKMLSLFGDVMSYLRLFALGLASASLAVTFNQLAGQVSRSGLALGVPLALLILVLGHGINLLLAIVSGFVHGLRLNFIEFFNWGLSGEGFPFRPFIKQEISS